MPELPATVSADFTRALVMFSRYFLFVFLNIFTDQFITYMWCLIYINVHKSAAVVVLCFVKIFNYYTKYTSVCNFSSPKFSDLCFTR